MVSIRGDTARICRPPRTARPGLRGRSVVQTTVRAFPVPRRSGMSRCPTEPFEAKRKVLIRGELRRGRDFRIPRVFLRSSVVPFASPLGAEGRRFKSDRPDQHSQAVDRQGVAGDTRTPDSLDLSQASRGTLADLADVFLVQKRVEGCTAKTLVVYSGWARALVHAVVTGAVDTVAVSRFFAEL